MLVKDRGKQDLIKLGAYIMAYIFCSEIIYCTISLKTASYISNAALSMDCLNYKRDRVTIRHKMGVDKNKKSMIWASIESGLVSLDFSYRAVSRSEILENSWKCKIMKFMAKQLENKLI